MLTAKEAAEYILSLSNPDVGELTSNLKLQKLLYYVQGVHLAAFSSPLYDEDIEAWSYGPVVRNVYQEYKTFGAGSISLSSDVIVEAVSKEKKRFIDNVYAFYGQYSAAKLMQMTHEESPWKTTQQSTIIPKHKIKSYFQTLPNLREIAFPSEEQMMKNAALLLLSDYENDKELTSLTDIDTDNFYEYE